MDYFKRRRRIGQNIVRQRKEQGLTQSQLGLIAGINAGYLSEVETGQANISLNKLFRIADALDVDPSKLLDLN